MTNSPEDWAERTGQEVRPPEPAPPRATFYGGQSLMDIHNGAKAEPHKVPCADCNRKDNTIAARVAEIATQKAEIEMLRDKLLEQAQVNEMRTSTAEAIQLRGTVRRLQATDSQQRRDLDRTYWRADSAEAKLHLHGIPVEELPARFRETDQ